MGRPLTFSDSAFPTVGPKELCGLGSRQEWALCRALCPGLHRLRRGVGGTTAQPWGHVKLRWVLGRLESQLELLVVLHKSLLLAAPRPPVILACPPTCLWGTGADTGARASTAEIGPHTRRLGFLGSNEHARVCSPGTHRYTHLGMQGPRCTCARMRAQTSICRHSPGGVNSGCAHVVVDRVAGRVRMGFNTLVCRGCLKHAHEGAPETGHAGAAGALRR